MTKRIHPARNARTLTGAASVMALISMVVGFQVNAVALTNAAPAAVLPADAGATASIPGAPATATPPRAPAPPASAPAPVQAISGGSGG